MSELLTQDEINALLQSVPTGDELNAEITEVEPYGEDLFGFPEQAAENVLTDGKRATRYDFKRPNRISKNVLQSLHFLHERYSRNFALNLSAYLRTICEIVLLSVDQLSYGEFLMSLPETTCINVVNISPHGGKLAFEINPTLVFAVIEKLMGGNTETPTQNREITLLEQNLIEGFIEMALKDLREIWRTIGETEFHLDRRETSPQLIQIVAPNEIVVVIVFEVRIGQTSGMMNFCIPAIYLEPFAVELRQESRTDISERMKPEDFFRIDEVLSRSLTKVHVDLAQKKVPIRTLLSLKEGEVLGLETSTHDPVTVKVEGITKFKAAVGEHKGMKAIKVLDFLDDSEEGDVKPDGNEDIFPLNVAPL